MIFWKYRDFMKFVIRWRKLCKRCVRNIIWLQWNFVMGMIIVMGCIISFLVGVPMIIENERVMHCYHSKSSWAMWFDWVLKCLYHHPNIQDGKMATPQKQRKLWSHPFSNECDWQVLGSLATRIPNIEMWWYDQIRSNVV